MPGKQIIPEQDFPRSIHRWNETGTGWVEVVLPKWAKRIAVQFQTNAGFLSHSEAEGGDFVDAVVNRAENVPADSIYSVPVTEGRSTSQSRVFVRVAVVPTEITVVAEANERG